MTTFENSSLIRNENKHFFPIFFSHPQHEIIAHLSPHKISHTLSKILIIDIIYEEILRLSNNIKFLPNCNIHKTHHNEMTKFFSPTVHCERNFMDNDNKDYLIDFNIRMCNNNCWCDLKLICVKMNRNENNDDYYWGVWMLMLSFMDLCDDFS